MEKKLSLFPLVFFAIGCMLASGVFTLSGDFAAAGAYTLATLIGWGITFIGMIALIGGFFGSTFTTLIKGVFGL